MNIRFLCFCLAIGITANALALELEEGMVFYVSPHGDDSWMGTIAPPFAGESNGPFATLERAQNAVREYKREHPDEPVTVLIQEGEYYLEKPLIFTPEDSGTQEAPITWKAYPGQNAIISAGKIVKLEHVQREGDIIKVTLPEVKEQGTAFTQVFINGERRTRARTPNQGFYLVDGELSDEENATFKYRYNQLKKEWAERGDVEWVTLVKWDEHRLYLLDVNEEEKTATVSGKMFKWSNLPDQRYYLENLRDGLDSPGEWYLDRQSGEFFYFLLPGESPEDLKMIVPVHEQVVILAGNPEKQQYVQHLHFEGLTFAHTAWKMSERGYDSLQAAHTVPGAFLANGAHHTRIERCKFHLLGNYAIEFATGCKHNSIVGNEMIDLGAGGVQIGTPEMHKQEHLQTTHHQITDNHMNKLGRIFHDAVGVLVAQSSHNLIAHNHIHDLYYTGISVGWSWGYQESNSHHNIIEYNLCHDIGQTLLSDMGGIYLLGPQPGTIVRNNVFHDIYSHTYGGWGLYTDEGSSQILLENNLVYNTKSAGFHQHYGRDNIIRNNIFAFGREHQVMRSRAEKHKSFTFERNIIYFNQGKLLGSNWSGTKENYELNHNLYWNTNNTDFLFDQYAFPEWQEKGQDRHSIIANPLFRDAENYDFSLEEDSPALLIGFKPFDTSTVGPRTEYVRK
ncbi:MAG: right-handed parallel beta-helix repeat-containing protein [bacterium]